MFYVSLDEMKLQIQAYSLRCPNEEFPHYLYNKLSYEKENPFTIDCPVVCQNSIYGKGLFAKTDIKKDSVLCIYPLHGISYLVDKEKGIYDQIVIKEQEEFYPEIFKDSKYCFNGNQDGSIKLYGCPKVNNHNWLNGHFINDNAYREGNIISNNYEDICRFIITYLINSKNNNCRIEFIKVGAIEFLAIVSNKNIYQGEEIFINYDIQYWLSTKGIKYSREELGSMLMLYLINKPRSQKHYYYKLLKKFV